MTRDCRSCGYCLYRDQPHPTHQRSYAVDCCLHAKIRNNHGVLACKAARAADGKCGPDATLWTARRS